MMKSFENGVIAAAAAAVDLTGGWLVDLKSFYIFSFSLSLSL